MAKIKLLEQQQQQQQQLQSSQSSAFSFKLVNWNKNVSSSNVASFARTEAKLWGHRILCIAKKVGAGEAIEPPTSAAAWASIWRGERDNLGGEKEVWELTKFGDWNWVQVGCNFNSSSFGCSTFSKSARVFKDPTGSQIIKLLAPIHSDRRKTSTRQILLAVLAPSESYIWSSSSLSSSEREESAIDLQFIVLYSSASGG